MEGKLLESIPETSKALGVGRSTTYRLIDAGELETVHIGIRHLVVVESRKKFVSKLLSMAGPAI